MFTLKQLSPLSCTTLQSTWIFPSAKNRCCLYFSKLYSWLSSVLISVASTGQWSGTPNMVIISAASLLFLESSMLAHKSICSFTTGSPFLEMVTVISAVLNPDVLTVDLEFTLQSSVSDAVDFGSIVTT
uniref:(northern house mosquito) hypothetical protein n=1 Tax=Culex pipiens TaxID=7175 RepID=A0A8D8MJV8_CULPI